MKTKYISLFILFPVAFILLLTNKTQAQKWVSMDDSTYTSIYKNRFDRGNIFAGLGGMLSSQYGDHTQIYPISFSLQSGYFIRKKWMIGAGFDYNLDLKMKDEEVTVPYTQYLIGPLARYYFKPKQKAFFIEAAALYGNERYESGTESGDDDYNYSDYGGSLALGLSLFVRNFEFELMYGGIIFSRDFADHIVGSQFIQINLTYRIPKKEKK